MYELGVLIVAATGLALLVAIPLGLVFLVAIARAFGEKARPWVYKFYALVVIFLMGWHYADKTYWSHVREVCVAQQKTMSPLTNVGGLLDEATEVSVHNILELLSQRHLRFVETRLVWDDPAHVRIVNRHDRISLTAQPSPADRFARFTLAEGGSPNCLTHEHRSRLEERPFLLPTCLNVSFHQKSEADHTLRYEPAEGAFERLFFLQATIRHAQSGNLMASMIAARDEFSDPQNRYYAKIDDPGQLSCLFSPHPAILSLVQGLGESSDRMLTTLVISPNPTLADLRHLEHSLDTVRPTLRFELVDVNVSNGLRVSHTWSEVTARAHAAGWSTDGEGRLNLNQRTYELIGREANGAVGYWGKLWTKDGFFVWPSNRGLWRGQGPAPLIAKYNERGNLLWAVKVEMPAAQQGCFMEPDVVVEKGTLIEVAGSCRGNFQSVGTEAGMRYRIGRFSFKAPAAASQ